MKTYYPEIQPFHTFFLETGSKHSVYVEESGNPEGVPVIFLHGGPCSGTKPDHRRFFNPEFYRIILFDQRGCGQSLPFGELENNTTQDLIADMEHIRKQLNIASWLVFGGSWGGALALLYAQQHYPHVSGLIIRAVFLARQQDLEWFAESGAGRIYPEQWQQLADNLPNESDNFLQSLYDIYEGKDETLKQRLTNAWMVWGAQVALGWLYQPPSSDEPITERMHMQVRMELHYARHHYFITEKQILDACSLLHNIPTKIIHGRQDLLCPLEAAMTLYRAMPHADLILLPNAGHIAQHEEMIDALVSATDQFMSKG